MNGSVRDIKSMEEDDMKLEDEFPPVSAVIRQNVHPPVPIPSNPVPSTVSSIAKLNGKTKKASILITYFLTEGASAQWLFSRNIFQPESRMFSSPSPLALRYTQRG